MKLICDRCGMRFRIADELVRGKVLKIRCKRCSYILEASLDPVDGAAAPGVRPRDDPPPDTSPPASSTRDGAPEEPYEAFDLTSPPRQPPRPPPRKKRHTIPPPLPEQEWFLARDNQRIGPMSLSKLQLGIVHGEVGPEDLVWRDGLGMWQPVVLVGELCAALNMQPADPPVVIPQVLPPPPQLSAPVTVSGLHPIPAQGPPGAAGAVTGLHQIYQPGHAIGSGAAGPTYVQVAVPPPVPARWPLYFSLAGGLLLLLASGFFLFLRKDSRAPETQPPVARLAPRETSRPPVASLKVAPRSPEQRVVVPEGPPPITVHRRNPPPIIVRRPPAQAPEAVGGIAARLNTSPGDVSAVLATRIMNRNRGSLRACDTLAERRGESLEGGRADFEVRVDASGTAVVSVQGKRISSRLLFCYRSMALQWKYPNLGSAYSTRFSHVH